MVAWFAGLGGLWESVFFLFSSEGSWRVASVWVVAWVLCDGLRAWFLAQSWLITMLPSLIARRWVGRQTL